MSFRNMGFFGCVLVSSVVLPVWLVPNASRAEATASEAEVANGQIESKHRAAMLQQKIDEYLKSGGSVDSDQFKHLMHELIKTHVSAASAQTKLAAEHMAKRKGRVAQELKMAKAQIEQQAEMLKQQIAPIVAEKEHLMRALREAHEEIERHREHSLPPLEETATRVFHLEHIDGNRLKNTIQEILGSDFLRLSSGVSPQTLVVRGGEEALVRAEELIQRMDQPRVSSKSESRSDLPRSLMVSIFWLSDGQTSPDTQPPAHKYLPGSVINALQKVGIENPFVVQQSNTSIIVEPDVETRFEANDLPAIVFGDRLRFNAKGLFRVDGGDRIRMWMDAFTDESHVSGSLAAPLDHFVVLGTANYASSEPDNQGNYVTSRFAYVVQVVEAESFAPEK